MSKIEKTRFVYLMSQPRSSVFKIGLTSDVVGRLRQFQTVVPGIRLRAAFIADVAFERKLHTLLGDWRVRHSRECFNIPAKVAAHIIASPENWVNRYGRFNHRRTERRKLQP